MISESLTPMRASNVKLDVSMAKIIPQDRARRKLTKVIGCGIIRTTEKAVKRTSRFARAVSECGGTWCELHQGSRSKIISELRAEALRLSKGGKQAGVVLRYRNRMMLVVQ